MATSWVRRDGQGNSARRDRNPTAGRGEQTCACLTSVWHAAKGVAVQLLRPAEVPRACTVGGSYSGAAEAVALARGACVWHVKVGPCTGVARAASHTSTPIL